jgi:hypothetical protein
LRNVAIVHVTLCGVVAIFGPNRCQHCREPIDQSGRAGRPRLYCGPACKQAAHRRRHAGEGSWPVTSARARYRRRAARAA